jgi:phosphate transport system permease protein
LCLLDGALAALLLVLGLKALPLLRKVPLGSLLATHWQPGRARFGILAFLAGSFEVTAVALALAAPLGLLSAMYLAEFTRPRVREWLRLPIDLLAGVPSVLFGLFGIAAVVPLVARAGQALGAEGTGHSVLAGGLVLALMVLPFLSALALDVLLAIPRAAREAPLALGATRWECLRHVLLKLGRRGLVSAVVLAFARAFGEAVAVMMVVGNSVHIARSPFAPAYPLPALIANNYGEMFSVPEYGSALLLAALALLLVVGGSSLGAALVLDRLGKEWQG